MVRYALLARLQAKHGKEDTVEKFLTDALVLANAESATRTSRALSPRPS